MEGLRQAATDDIRTRWQVDRGRGRAAHCEAAATRELAIGRPVRANMADGIMVEGGRRLVGGETHNTSDAR